MEENYLKNYYPDTDPKFLDNEATWEQKEMDEKGNCFQKYKIFHDSDKDVDPRFTSFDWDD